MVQLHSGHMQTESRQWPLDQWQNHVKAYRPNRQNELIEDASSLAYMAGYDVAAANGESCYHLGLTMADFLLDLGLDQEVISATVIYNCYRQDILDLEDIEQQLSANVAKLVKGTMKMDAVSELYSQDSTQATYTQIDNIRKMLLAIVDDLRVVFIKLAEQLALLTRPGTLSQKKRSRLAHEGMALYAPLASRLGVYQLKWLIEDLSFAILNRDMYRYIAKSLNERRIDRELFIQQMVDEIKKLLRQHNIQDAPVYGRAKHIYGIYRKMQNKNLDFPQLHDIYAVRIIVPTVENCYTILSHVHDQWTPIAEEFDDYIATPKPNGYRSIHTAVIGPEKRNVEIQIRTFEMHEHAEMGMAAHWAYKENVKHPQNYQTKITWLRQLMAWQKEVTESESSSQEIYSQIFDDRVFVFTPQGEVLDLPAGATPLDFAYHIHSDIGHRCRGAKVDGKLVPLNTPLKTGNRVEILTAQQSHPSRDWINPEEGYLATARARAKVHHWFRQQAQERNIAEGETIYKKGLKRYQLDEQHLPEVLKTLNYEDRRHLFAALGRGEVTVNRVMRLLQGNNETAESPVNSTELAQPKSTKAADVYSSGIPKLLTQTANCCKPVPGDPILGYVTQTHGISIHHSDCNNLKYMQKQRPQRVIEVEWGQQSTNFYPVDIIVTVHEDAKNITREIKSLLDNQKCALINFHFLKQSSDDTHQLLLTIEVNSSQALEQIINTIKLSPNVLEVNR